MPQFPFMNVPPEVDAATLYQQSPFLLLCILTASLDHNPSLQDALEMKVRNEIASRLIVGVERSMDLLQGLLVHTAWHVYHWRTYHTHMYMLLQMAAMVVIDLGLDREESFGMQAIPADGRELDQMRELVAPHAAGQRALLGCYYLCSKSSIFRRQVQMRHTRWMDQCAEALANKPEYPTDSHLREMRRENLPIEALERVLEQMDKGQSEREGLLASLTTENDWPLRIELGAVPALVLGRILRYRSDVFQLRNLNLLESLTASSQKTIDTFVVVPSTTAIHLPVPTYGTIWYCLLMLAKLCLLFSSEEAQKFGVDKSTVQKNGVAIIAKFKELTIGDDVWANSIKVVERMLSWLEKASTEGQSPFTPPKKRLTQRRDGSCQTTVQASVPGDGHKSAREAAIAPHRAPEHASPTGLWDQTPDDPAFDLWQQMLDSFTWVGPGMENDFSSTDLGNLR
ncbi:uncharacterized protein BJX67DRAFT_379007 [Aspergillus lucknowensis]|uniref:Transcription factor domain-containing protein n=1 Tax=Aspergillus lucknowensis TaxID=176173 RepID=A0ABR4LY34_9EURO